MGPGNGLTFTECKAVYTYFFFIASSYFCEIGVTAPFPDEALKIKEVGDLIKVTWLLSDGIQIQTQTQTQRLTFSKLTSFPITTCYLVNFHCLMKASWGNGLMEWKGKDSQDRKVVFNLGDFLCGPE